MNRLALLAILIGALRLATRPRPWAERVSLGLVVAATIAWVVLMEYRLQNYYYIS